MAKIAFFSPVQEGILEVENLIRSQADGFHPDLRAALDLLLSSGGKRVRPALTLLTGSMLGAADDRLVTLGAAIELLHTASLVHDDLIDSSLLRRGTPTLNSKWSPGATVLTGDFIFARAAKLAAETNSVEVMKLFAQTLTIIVNGEITQLFSTGCHFNREDYYERIYAKTASLFETATTAAALISPVDEQTVECIRRYGYEIGMAFQIIDDILDFTADPMLLGKPVGSDLRQGLVTLPAIYYAESHPNDPDVQALIKGSCGGDESCTSRLVESIRTSSAIQAAHNEARGFVQRGLAGLKMLKDGVERQAMEELALYIVDRQQ